ncbi:MAG TPA: PD40 domain-containing protein [Candidatus Limisoma gallistercoris]|nr:PD40 domain-containing protein [Candidatus Limisoma gallistercoris]
MRIKLFMAALLCVFLSNAQDVKIVRHEQLLKGIESQCYNPVLSPDGQKVLFTQSDYEGLNVYDIADDVVTPLASDRLAGFSPAFSKDGKSVYFLSQTRENMLVYREMKSVNLDGTGMSTVMGKSRGMLHPVAVDGGVVTVSDNGRKLKAKSNGGTYAYSAGKKIVVVKNGIEKKIAPVPTKYTYIWESLSPDGTKILFYAGGKGAYICDLDGNLVAELGKYTSPAWCGNDYVVAVNATHDGHQYETSQIVLLKVDGSYKKELTAPVSMSMHPTASASGDRLTYNTIDGRLFLMDLRIK